MRVRIIKAAGDWQVGEREVPDIPARKLLATGYAVLPGEQETAPLPREAAMVAVESGGRGRDTQKRRERR